MSKRENQKGKYIVLLENVAKQNIAEQISEITSNLKKKKG